MKSYTYKINNLVEKIRNDKNTLFLDAKELKQVTSKLKKDEYKIYYPYKESEKVMLYTGKIPKISLLKINTVENLKHQDILGSLFSLNIDSSYFGDIVLYNNYYYVYVLYNMKDYIKDNLKLIGKNRVTIEEVSLSILDNYKRAYEEFNIIVSSLRLDSIVSAIINSSRAKALEKLQNKEVIVNYDVVLKNSYILKENDIFSIRRFGKYKFVGIVKSTKKDNYIVKCLKYI